MARGLDTATPCSQSTIDAIIQAGYAFVARYYCTGGLWKRLGWEEALRLSHSGIGIVSVFQNYNDAPDRFSASLGKGHAEAAQEYARKVIGQPKNTPIYFAVDFDASDAEIKGVVTDYFKAVKRVFSDRRLYKVGVYGSGAVCGYLKDDADLAEYSWLSMSTGWRGYRAYNNRKRWNLKQIRAITIAEVEFDTNEEGLRGSGSWRVRQGTGWPKSED